MSIEWIVSVWKTSPYKGSSLVVHLALADYAGEEGMSWPSMTTLAGKSRISERRVQEILVEMEQDGVVTKELRPGRSTMYHLLRPPYVGVKGVRPTAPPPATHRTPGVQPTAPITVIEPSIEPSSLTDADASGAFLAPDPGDPEEPTYEPIGNEFGDGRGFDSNEEQGGVTKKSSIPKWKIIPAEAMQYAKHWKIKYFRHREDRRNWRLLKHSLEQGLIPEEWIEQSLEWATKRPEGGANHPRWSFGGFLKCASNRENYSDWEIKRANALRKGGDAQKFSGTLEELDKRYSD